MNNQLSRRRFIELSVTGVAGLSFELAIPGAGLLNLARADSGSEPHFFLQLLFPGGMDASYLFDARPLAMTQAKLIQNYLGEEPFQWTGANGQTTWATSLAKPLEPFKNDFSILNGVMMTPQFDGHTQNLNFLLTGSPFGGDCYIPQLNLAGRSHRPLDCITNGQLYADIVNFSSSVPLTVATAKGLIAKIKNSALMSVESPLMSFVMGRYDANNRGHGGFSLGSKAMKEAALSSPALAELIKQVTPPVADPKDSKEEKTLFLPLVAEFFRKGLSTSVMITYDTFLDVHAAADAKKNPELVKQVVGRIAEVLSFLKNTPFDQGRSLLDVTTVMACSEFSRTMRQDGNPIDNTGTDHNALANTIILGGKGVKPGLLLGATDQQVAGEKLSGAHLAVDTSRIKTVARPFDFKTSRPREDLPEGFSAADYLTIASVVNSVYRLFGVSEDYYRHIDRNMPVAPVLSGLLT